jgi:hypothetical protein
MSVTKEKKLPHYSQSNTTENTSLKTSTAMDAQPMDLQMENLRKRKDHGELCPLR